MVVSVGIAGAAIRKEAVASGDSGCAVDGGVIASVRHGQDIDPLETVCIRGEKGGGSNEEINQLCSFRATI